MLHTYRPLRPCAVLCVVALSQRYIQLREMGGNQDEDQGDPDPEGALGVVSDTAPTARKTCSVHSGRAPVEEILFAEHEIALREGFDRVKVRQAGALYLP